jgi:hypothetical protein
MSVTIVNDYFFKPDGNIAEGKAAAAELVKYFKSEVPNVQLSLWLESRENPLHHYHITVFAEFDTVERVKESMSAVSIHETTWCESERRILRSS